MSHDGKKSGEDPDRDILVRMNVHVVVPEHLDARVYEEAAEDVDNPVKTLDQRRADKNHRQTHNQRAHHAPKQHAMLKSRRYFEIREDQQEDEKVINRERQFDQVAGEKLKTALRPLVMKHEAPENQG